MAILALGNRTSQLLGWDDFELDYDTLCRTIRNPMAETVLEPGRPLSSERAFNSDRIRINIISQGYEHEKR